MSRPTSQEFRVLQEKLKIIEEVEKNPKAKRLDIAKRLGIAPALLNCIYTKRRQIRKQVEKFGCFFSPRKGKVTDHDGTTTTMRQLLHVLNTTSTPSRPLPGSAYLKRADERIVGVDCDEVYPRLYIGDAGCAKSKAYLKLLGVNYVLNTAEGSRFGQVDTGHLYYRDMPTVRYMGFPMIDMPVTNIAKYFYVAAKFIEEGITSGGRVLVHCHMGMSRSATCVLAWLMICRHMTAVEALRTVRMHRDIRPNDGFLRQLMELDNDLKLQRATKNLRVR